MTLQRVQMLLEPAQRQILAELAKSQGKSIAEVTRQAIDAGLEQLVQEQRQRQMEIVLTQAQFLRESMPVIELDILGTVYQMREERDHELSRRH